jgi:hypothetical protein
MEGLNYNDFVRILGQIVLESRLQIEKLQKENAQLVKLLQEAKGNNQNGPV